jgi:GNAT superfamily N-acetyltransferase
VTEVLGRVAGYLADRSADEFERVDVPPFRALLHRTSDRWWLSGAMPVAPVTGDVSAAIAEVRDLFAARSRPCRFEWVREIAPELEEALVAAGFPRPKHEPLLVLDPAALVRPDPPDGVVARLLEPSELPEARRLVHEVFRELGDLNPADVQLAVEELGTGRRREAGVWISGRLVAAGDHSPWQGVTEVAGIATHPAYRRRGLGGLVTAVLCADALALGCEVVWLTAASRSAARVYERLGFRHVGTGLGTGLR